MNDVAVIAGQKIFDFFPNYCIRFGLVSMFWARGSPSRDILSILLYSGCIRFVSLVGSFDPQITIIIILCSNATSLWGEI
jgi:hypothetical protein